jgi:hypothetical protein
MSSVSAAFYQTPFKGSNFASFATVTLYLMNPSATLSAIMTTAAFDNATDDTASYSSTTLFKDIGKTIVTVNEQGLHTDKYQLVMLLGGNNPDQIEGISQVVGYVRVSSTISDGEGGRPVTVARTG